jgi:uncharacterized membrane protein YfcA
MMVSAMIEWMNMALVLGAGLVGGFLNTVAGGGSLLTLPVLIFMGLPAAVANGTNRVAIFFQNATAMYSFKSKGVADFKFSLWVTVPALVGAWLGAQIAIELPDQVFNKVLGVIMLAVMAHTILSKSQEEPDGGVRPQNWYSRENILAAITFFFLGIYGGFIQAGIGFLILAALTAIKKMDLVKANAVKVFVVFFYTIVALAAFVIAGKVDWGLGLTLAVGNSVGAWYGSRFAVLKGAKWIRWVLAVAVLAFSVKLFFFS